MKARRPVWCWTMSVSYETILDAIDQARHYGQAEVNILEVAHPSQIQRALPGAQLSPCCISPAMARRA